VKLQLGHQSQLEEEVAKVEAKLNALEPTAREQVAAAKKAALKPAEVEILSTPPEKLTPAQQEQIYQLREKVEVSNREVADQIGKLHPDLAKQALLLAGELDRVQRQLQYTINYKADSNYDYWDNRAKMEQTPDALAAREDMFEAHQAFRQADLMKAKQLYQAGFAKWRKVFDAFPKALDNDVSTGDDLIDYVKQYRDLLDQLDETIGDDFPLWDVIQQFDKEQVFREELDRHLERTGKGKPAGADAAKAQSDEAKSAAAADSKSTGATAKKPAADSKAAESGRTKPAPADKK
jgi:hypothetical protein